MDYTTWGSVRGDCGHVHGTVAKAEACLRHDQRVCLRQGGYSDREVRMIESPAEITSYDVTRGPGERIVE